MPTIEPKLEAAHSDESASLGAEGSSTVVLNADETGIASSQETGVDVVSSNKTAHEVETEVEAGTQVTDTATSSNDLAATELSEAELPVMPNTEVFIYTSCENVLADPVLHLKGDSTKHVTEAAIVGLATTEGFSSVDKVIPEVTHEPAPEVENDSVESETFLNVELQREHEVDVTAAGTEDTHPAIHSSFHNDSTPVPLPLEPEMDLIKPDLVAERQVETTSTATTKSVTTDVDVQPDPSSSLDDTSNIKDGSITELEVVQHVGAVDTPLEDTSSSTKESQNNVQLEPDVAQAEEEPSAIAQVTAENLSPKIENVGGISPAPGEIIPIREDATTSIANVEDQVIAPVDVRSEHAVVVETSSTDKPGEDIISSNAEENPETLTPPVEPSYKSSDDKIVVVSIFFSILMHC